MTKCRTSHIFDLHKSSSSGKTRLYTENQHSRYTEVSEKQCREKERKKERRRAAVALVNRMDALLGEIWYVH